MENLQQKKKKPDTMYLVSSLIYVIMLFKGRQILTESGWSMPMKAVVSALVVLSFVVCLIMYVVRVRKLDERERRIQLDALSIAFPLTMILSFTLAQLELFIPFLKDDWTYMRVTALFIVFYFVGNIIARIRYS